MQLLHTQIAHNERWPRKGVMYAPKYLLKKDDELIFNWAPKEINQYLRIKLENESDSIKIILPKTNEIRIKEDGLYSILIENLPEYRMYGYLTINLISDLNKNPFPETKYQYEKKHKQGQLLKKCLESYVDEEIGANVIQKSETKETGNLLFDSTNESFDEAFESKNFIYQQKLFYFENGQRVHISFKRPENSSEYYGAKIEKLNSKGFYGNLTENCFFDCNNSEYYIIELFKTIANHKEKPQYLGELKVSSVNKMKTQHDYQIVYNELFRKHEIEPKEASM